MNAAREIAEAPMSFAVTFFRDFAAKTKVEQSLTLDQLAAAIRKVSRPEKDDLPWLKFARFGPLPNPKTSGGSLRWNGNVLRLSGIVADYDAERMTPEEAAERLDKAGIIAIVYTSPSHMLNGHGPRWRVGCPFAKELPPEDHYRMMARLNGLFGGILAPESWTLSQAYYYGAVNGNPAHQAIVVDGAATIDRCDELDRGAIGKPNGDSHAQNGGAPEAAIGDIEAALDLIPNDCDWDGWNRIGMAVWRASGGSEDGFAAFDRWSLKCLKKYDPEETRFRWDHLHRSPPNNIGFGTLVHLAREAEPGWTPPSRAREESKPNGADRGPRIWVDDDEWTEAELPQRGWVARRYALRGAVTLLAGPPSALKSSLMLAWASAIALYQSHGDFCPTAPGCVIVYNVEDDQTEQRRRLSAVLRQFRALPADIAGKLVRTGPTGIGTLFTAADGIISPTPAMERLRDLIRERRPAALIADPLAELHCAEENDNTGLRAVIAEFRAIATEFNIAVILVHHTRKGAVTPGDPDSARGASAIIGASRIVLTLVTMPEDDAERLGLPKDRQSRARYVRLDDAKQNYADIGDAKWYEKAVYVLDNNEAVVAAVPWNIPDATVSAATANLILDVIDAGIDEGKRRFSDNNAAETRAAWPVVTKHIATFNERQARELLRGWIERGVLFRQTYDDPVDRKPRSGLYVNPANRPGNTVEY